MSRKSRTLVTKLFAMKKVTFLFFISMLFTSVLATAQTKLSPEQEAFFNKLMSGINPRHVNWVKTTAAEVNAKNLAEEDIRNRATRYAGQGIKDQQDIEALISLVMMQCAKDQQEDLKSIMAQVKSLKEQKEKLRNMIANANKQRTLSAVQMDSIDLLNRKTVALKQRQNPDTIKLVRSSSWVKTVSKNEMDAIVTKLKNDLDSMSEMGEMESLRMQMLMDRRSKIMSTLSNLLKKISKTADEIVQNLK